MSILNIQPFIDLYVNQANPNTNYNSDHELLIGCMDNNVNITFSAQGTVSNVSRTWLLIDLSLIPISATINSAILNMNGFVGNNSNGYAAWSFDIARSTNITWDNTLTWNTAPNGSVGSVSNSYDTANGSFVTLNVTSDVTAALSSRKVSWRLKVQNETDSVNTPYGIICSDADYGNGAGPFLAVDYTLAGGTSTPKNYVFGVNLGLRKQVNCLKSIPFPINFGMRKNLGCLTNKNFSIQYSEKKNINCLKNTNFSLNFTEQKISRILRNSKFLLNFGEITNILDAGILLIGRDGYYPKKYFCNNYFPGQYFPPSQYISHYLKDYIFLLKLNLNYDIIGQGIKFNRDYNFGLSFGITSSEIRYFAKTYNIPLTFSAKESVAKILDKSYNFHIIIGYISDIDGMVVFETDGISPDLWCNIKKIELYSDVPGIESYTEAKPITISIIKG